MVTGKVRSRIASRPRRLRVLAAVLALQLAVVPTVSQAQVLPQTGAEKVNFSRTTSHDELVDFLFEVQGLTDRMLIRHLSTTDEGRMLPLVILGTPPASNPRDALLSGKPLLYITGSVHGGERSGKEGALQFIRELTLGSQRSLLDSINVIIIPSLNPDGAERGSRTNSLGYDMNRDFVALETPEINATVGLLREWAPDVYVDAHNGGSYPYNLTYQATLHPSADQEIVKMARGPMYEAVKRHLESQGMKMYWYSGPRQSPGTGEWSWTTTEPWLRKQHSYGGFQNVITLLYEAPVGGGLNLERQAAAQREGYIGLARYMAQNKTEVRKVVTEARLRAMARTNQVIGMDPQASAYPEKEEFYVRAPINAANQSPEPVLVTGTNRTLYVPGFTRSLPWAYAFDGRLNRVAEHLKKHGIQIEKLQAPVTVSVERYRLDSLRYASTPYQNHLMATAKVTTMPGEMELQTGMYIIRTGQPVGMLAALLLEPDNEDSLVSWNFFDNALPRPGGNAPLPIYRIMNPVGMRTLLWD